MDLIKGFFCNKNYILRGYPTIPIGNSQPVYIINPLNSLFFVSRFSHNRNSVEERFTSNFPRMQGGTKFLGWYLKIAAVSALCGASMELFMIHTGFCISFHPFFISFFFYFWDGFSLDRRLAIGRKKSYHVLHILNSRVR